MVKTRSRWTLFPVWAFVLVLVLIYNPIATAFAAQGSLDPVFGGSGVVSHDMGGGVDEAWVIIAQPDGKVIVAGGNYSNNGENFPDGDLILARYNLNGTLDDSFGAGGIVTTDVNNAHHYDMVRAIALQPDGRILVAGFTTIIASDSGGDDDVVVARYHPDGTLDNTFGTNGIVITHVDSSLDRARAILVLPDGRIAIAGYSYISATGQIDFLAARYNSNGSPDTTFNGDGNSDGWIRTANGASWSQGFAAVLQTDGRMIVAGQTQDMQYMLVRYQVDGSLDNSFGTNGIVVTPDGAGHIYAMALQPDGYIVTAGYTTTNKNNFGLARYTPSGVLDPTFGVGGHEYIAVSATGDDVAWSMALQADGKIVVGGVSNSDLAVVRLTTSGSLDPAFGASGIFIYDSGNYDEGHGVVLLPDGKIGVVGDCNGVYCTLRLQIADRVWIGGGADRNWSTAANWQGGILPASNEIVQFDSTSTKPAVVDIPVTVGGISIGAGYRSKVTLNNDLTVNGQAIIAPYSGLDANGHNLTAGTLQNNGVLTQTLLVNGNSDVNFFNTGGYGGLTVNANNANLGNTRVLIYGNQKCDTQNSTVERCFNITPANPVGRNASLTFYYLPSELNGSACSTMNTYHWNSTSSYWEGPLTVAGRSCTAVPYSVRVSGVSSFSPFALRTGSTPTVVSIIKFQAGSPHSFKWLFSMAALLAIGFMIIRRRKR